jgi:hypothetical protein
MAATNNPLANVSHPKKVIDLVKLSWIPHSVHNVFARSLSLCLSLFDDDDDPFLLLLVTPQFAGPLIRFCLTPPTPFLFLFEFPTVSAVNQMPSTGKLLDELVKTKIRQGGR